MDRFTVFCQTQSGEHEIAQPSKSIEKTARSLLEIVDGVATVGELTSRLGGSRTVRALEELERLGLVETLDARMARIALQEARRVRGNAPLEASLGEGVAMLDGHTQTYVENDFAVPSNNPRQALASGSRATIFDRLSAFFGNLSYTAAKGGGDWGRKLRRTLLGLLILAVLGGIGLILTVTVLGALKIGSQIEREASAWLGTPVKIGSVGVGFHPWPGFTFHDIRIGEDGESRIPIGWGHPDWFRWATGQTQHLSLTLDNPNIQAALIHRLARLQVPPGAWRLASASVRNASVPFGSLKLEGLSGELLFAADSRWQMLRLRPQEGDFTLEAENHEGVPWVSLRSPEYKFGQIKLVDVLLSGVLGATGFPAAQFSANWLSGALQGKAKLDFSEAAQVSGRLEASGISMEQLSELAGAPELLGGRLSGPFNIEAKAANIDELSAALRVSGKYQIDNGTLGRLDLFEAMRRNDAAPFSGGTTRFTRMEGSFVYLSGNGLKVEMRQLDAGALSGSGTWAVDRNGALRGSLRTDLRTPLERLEHQYRIEGSLQMPQLRP